MIRRVCLKLIDRVSMTHIGLQKNTHPPQHNPCEVGIRRTYSSTADCSGAYDSDNSLEASYNKQAFVRQTVIAPRTRVKILIRLQVCERIVHTHSTVFILVRTLYQVLCLTSASL